MSPPRWRRLRLVSRLLVPGLFMVLTAARPAHAAELPSITFSGFATLGAVTTDRDDLWFTRYGVNHPGDSDPDFSPDSLLGLQASARLTTADDVTLQALVREDGDQSWGPHTALAFVRHTFASGVSVRLGRLRSPFFMLSDSLYVNYANPWMRPPVEVYNLNPFNDLDGADLIFNTRLSDFAAEIQPYYGRARMPFPMGSVKLKSIAGIKLALTRKDLALHLGHSRGRFAMERRDARTRMLLHELHRRGFDGAAADISGRSAAASFDSLGVQWDDGRWQVIAEVVRRRANRYVTTSKAWYLGVGHRFGDLTPYVVFARQQLDEPVAEPGVPVPAWDVFLASRNNAQRSVTVGARWDVARFAALKAELSHARIDHDSWGSYFPRSDALALDVAGGRANTFSFSVDLSF